MNIVLKIEGMHCGGCVGAVRRVLSAVPSVEAVTVDLDSGSATVTANAGVDRASLIAAVEDAGYDASIDG